MHVYTHIWDSHLSMMTLANPPKTKLCFLPHPLHWLRQRLCPKRAPFPWRPIAYLSPDCLPPRPLEGAATWKLLVSCVRQLLLTQLWTGGRRKGKGRWGGGHREAGVPGFLKHGPSQGAPLASSWPPLSPPCWGSLGALTQPPGLQV